MTETNLESLQTPCAVVDAQRMMQNIQRLQARLKSLGVAFRPHLKTSKCLEVAHRMMTSPTGPATVSTLLEAEQFASGGVRDILYAVGITPGKLDRVIALRKQGIDLIVTVDSREQAQAIAAHSRAAGVLIPVLIEVDSDGHRSGVRADEPLLLEIAQDLEHTALRGVMTHAGGSYNKPGEEAITVAAEQERDAVVTAASRLRSAGFNCPIVSVGSTPTAHFASDLNGVTEVRAGVFVFFDLVMAGLGVCRIEDIALSVLATVIGHRRDKGWIIVDAGWMAMSRDRGTADQMIDQGYGVVCNVEGLPFEDLVMTQANQEHGILAIRAGSSASLPDLPIGTKVRILPNHACATGAQHDCYHVLDGSSRTIATWNRFSGW